MSIEICKLCTQAGYKTCKIEKKVNRLVENPLLTTNEKFDELLELYGDNDDCTFLGKRLSSKDNDTHFIRIIERLIRQKESNPRVHTNGNTKKENNELMSQDTVMVVSSYLDKNRVSKKHYPQIHEALKVWYESIHMIIKPDIDLVSEALARVFQKQKINPSSNAAGIITEAVHNITGILLNGEYPEDWL